MRPAGRTNKRARRNSAPCLLDLLLPLSCRALTCAFTYQLRSVIVIVIVREDDFPRLPAELQDIQAGPSTVGRVDKPAIVHFDVVGHVAGGSGVGIAYRDIERHFNRTLWLADIPHPYTAGEVRKNSQ